MFLFLSIIIAAWLRGSGTHNTHEDTSLVKPGRKLNRGRCFVHGGAGLIFLKNSEVADMFVYVSTRSSLVKHIIASHSIWSVCGNTLNIFLLTISDETLLYPRCVFALRLFISTMSSVRVTMTERRIL